MRAQSGLQIDTVAGERDKFTAPVVLVHGLWATAAVWRRSMGFLAHLGWTCHAATFNHRVLVSDERSAFGDLERQMLGLIEACASPPILIGHDLGAWLALCCRSRVRAVVAMAPLMAPPLSTSRLRLAPSWPRSWLRSGPTVAAPSGRLGSVLFESALPAGEVEEPLQLLYALDRQPWPVPTAAAPPALLLAGAKDLAAPIEAARVLAQQVRADLLAVDAGHAMIWTKDWERRVGEVHRWLVRTLGEPLLAPSEEEDE